MILFEKKVAYKEKRTATPVSLFFLRNKNRTNKMKTKTNKLRKKEKNIRK